MMRSPTKVLMWVENNFPQDTRVANEARLLADAGYQVAVIALKGDLARGRVVTRLSDPDFKVPTTIDDLGRRLYAVNARFGTPNPDGIDYQVVQLKKPKGR